MQKNIINAVKAKVFGKKRKIYNSYYSDNLLYKLIGTIRNLSQNQNHTH